MVVLKSSKAEGSFLGLGTHVWLVVTDSNGEKTSFSGAKIEKRLGVIKNYKRDFDKLPRRGEIEILPPPGLSDEQWTAAVLVAGDDVIKSMHLKLRFSGFFPCGKIRGNCCMIAKKIIDTAGGVIPSNRHLYGLTPGLKIDC